MHDRVTRRNPSRCACASSTSGRKPCDRLRAALSSHIVSIATIVVTFAPGTLEPTFTLFSILLDTDESPATGNAGTGADATTFGWDYSISGVNPQGSTTAQVSRALGPALQGQVTGVGTAIVTFPAADQARVTVPVSMLGNDDGRMSFKVICQQWITGSINTGVLDWMPDVGLPPATVR